MAIQYQAYRKRENFPVASWVIPRKARKAVLAFYDFARGADNIADHVTMEPDEKRAALLALKESIAQHFKNQLPPWAVAYYAAIHSGMLKPVHGEQLLEAFIQDTHKNRYATMDELLDYCRLSAVPVGRAVLDACREHNANVEASDAVCIVLQLINHMQDIKDDYTGLNRVYLPQDWMDEAGVVETQLADNHTTQPLRQVIDRVLDYCESQQSMMCELPKTLQSRRLRIEIALIICLAMRLIRKLKTADPLRHKIRLSWCDKSWALVKSFRMARR